MRRVFRMPFGRHIEREVDDELAFHIEMRTQRLIAAGVEPEAARREALRQFGDMSSVRENCVTMDEQRERAMRRAFRVGELMQDAAYAMRSLRRNIGFTAIVVFALALGIGANTAIFTLINAVMVRSLPVSHPEELVAIGDPTRVSSLSEGEPRTDLLSYPLYKDVRDRNRAFTGVLASGRTGRIYARIDGDGGELESPRSRFVSGNYFSVLGVKAAAGRVFDESHDREIGAAPVVTMSHGYWTRRFQNDPSVIGRQIVVNGARLTIIGVAQAGFTGDVVGTAADLWIPMTMQHAVQPNQRRLDNRHVGFILALGRLKPGVTIDQARADLTTVIRESITSNARGASARDFLASSPKYYVSDGSRGFSRIRDNFQAPLFTLMIGVGLLLCIICANVANLLLARSIARGREMAVRLALGANRARLVRHLLTEGLILAALGAATGLLVAWWGSQALLVMAADGENVSLNLGLDGWVLGFTLAVCCLSVLLFGLAPALRASRVDLATTMRANAHAVAGSALGTRGQRAPLGRLLIAGQVALSVVLLVGAGMLVRSLRHIERVDVGMDREHLLILDVDTRGRGYRGPQLATTTYAIRDRVSRIPGVAAVGYSENGIFSGTESGTTVQVPGFTARSPEDSTVAYDLVGPGYFGAIGGRILQGRDMADEDEGNLARTIVVNQSLAKFFFPGQNAVGKFIRISDSVALQIVGVAADTRDHELNGEPARRMYFPYVHRDTMVGLAGALRFAIRTHSDPRAIVQQVRAAVVAIDPTLPIDGVDPLVTLMRQSITGERLVARLATGFGVLALLLAAIGLYGVMTYAVTRRTGEIGLRAALGAERGDVLRMVLGDAMRLVGIGVVTGLPIAIAATRLLKTQLHGVEAIDPWSLAFAVVVLAASAVGAVLLPAWRASRVSPIVALRAD